MHLIPYRIFAMSLSIDLLGSLFGVSCSNSDERVETKSDHEQLNLN